jgi:hypothetical protein
MATVRPEKSTARPAVADDEEGIVHRHAEAHHGDHVHRVHGDGGGVRERDRGRHARGDPEDAHAEGERRPDHGAEDEDQQERHHRPDHPFRALDGPGRRLREIVVERHRPHGKDLEHPRTHFRSQLRVDAALALAQAKRRELRRPALELDGGEDAMAVPRDAPGVRHGVVVGGHYSRHAGVGAEGLERLPHGGLEGGLLGLVDAAAEDQAEGGRALRELLPDELDRAPGLGEPGHWIVVEAAPADHQPDRRQEGSSGDEEDGPAVMMDEAPPGGEHYPSASSAGVSVLGGA